jgi:outer membrane protein assembly factor BamD (BamD/ComL family)
MHQPSVNDTIRLESSSWHFTEHPALLGSGFPYGQEGRAGIVYQLADGDDDYCALKVFKPRFKDPSLVSLTEKLEPLASISGLTVCDRSILTPQNNSSLLRQHPDLLYATLMPWIEGQTWSEIVEQRLPLTPEQSLGLAQALLEILVGLEQKGIAHGDLSSANLIVGGLTSGDISVELVDVEQLYAQTLDRPAMLPSSSPGYAHHLTSAGIWQADMDRFAGAILLAEMLGWSDERIREAARDNSYFSDHEVQQDSERYRLLQEAISEQWGTGIGGLLDRAWRSEKLQDCPTFGAWQIAWPVSGKSGNSASIDELLKEGRECTADQDWTGAIAAYEAAMEQTPQGSALNQEIVLIITGLQARADRAESRRELLASAKSAEDAGNLGKAVECYERLLSEWPNDPESEKWALALEANQTEAHTPSPQQQKELEVASTLPLTNKSEDIPLEELFDAGLAAYVDKRWAEAKELLGALVRQQPDYRRSGQQASDLLAATEKQLASPLRRMLVTTLRYFASAIAFLAVVFICLAVLHVTFLRPTIEAALYEVMDPVLGSLVDVKLFRGSQECVDLTEKAINDDLADQMKGIMRSRQLEVLLDKDTILTQAKVGKNAAWIKAEPVIVTNGKIKSIELDNFQINWLMRLIFSPDGLQTFIESYLNDNVLKAGRMFPREITIKEDSLRVCVYQR